MAFWRASPNLVSTPVTLKAQQGVPVWSKTAAPMPQLPSTKRAGFTA